MSEEIVVKGNFYQEGDSPLFVVGTFTDLIVTGNFTVNEVVSIVSEDKVILLNSGNATADLIAAGINLEGDSAAVVGYFRTGTVSTWLMKSPNHAGILTHTFSGANVVLSTAGTLGIESVVFNAGVVTGATSITSTVFVGALTGNVTGNVSGTAATVTGATQSAITSVGTLTGFTSTGIDDNCTAERFDLTDTILDVLTGANLRAVDGLLFGSDTAAANMLDDYEKDTYPASITCSVAGGYNTDANQTDLAYTKIGRLVHVQGQLGITSESGTPDGNIQISLPFASADLADFAEVGIGTVNIFNHSGTIDNAVVKVGASASIMTILKVIGAGGALTTVNKDDVDTAWGVRFSISYLAA